jgi:hypothetical protein
VDEQLKAILGTVATGDRVRANISEIAACVWHYKTALVGSGFAEDVAQYMAMKMAEIYWASVFKNSGAEQG